MPHVYDFTSSAIYPFDAQSYYLFNCVLGESDDVVHRDGP